MISIIAGISAGWIILALMQPTNQRISIEQKNSGGYRNLFQGRELSKKSTENSIFRSKDYKDSRSAPPKQLLESLNKSRSISDNIDFGILITEVATRIRAGATVDRAWKNTLAKEGLINPNLINNRTEDLQICDDQGVPWVFYNFQLASWKQIGIKKLGFIGESWQMPLVNKTTLSALPGTIAACRITHHVGAPIADVLDACAQGITEAAEAASARAIAIAGPASSAKMLKFLPFLCWILAWMIGVDVIGVLFDFRFGTLASLVGICFMILGNIWVKKLLKSAQEDHE